MIVRDSLSVKWSPTSGPALTPPSAQRGVAQDTSALMWVKQKNAYRSGGVCKWLGVV